MALQKRLKSERRQWHAKQDVYNRQSYGQIRAPDSLNDLLADVNGKCRTLPYNNESRWKPKSWRPYVALNVQHTGAIPQTHIKLSELICHMLPSLTMRIKYLLKVKW